MQSTFVNRQAISPEDLALVFTALRLTSTQPVQEPIQILVTQLGRCYAMTSTSDTPDFVLPAALDKQWAKLLCQFPKFMALSNSDGIHAHLDGAEDICALFEPHRAAAAMSMAFHFKISPIENKVHQVNCYLPTTPRSRDELAPAAVEEFTRLFDMYREEHRAHIKAVNEANCVTALEKASLQKASSTPKTDPIVAPPASSSKDEAWDLYNRAEWFLQKFTVESAGYKS
ncbi:hypothetical protein B0H14DRAFT_3445924 [Mycena olivaceomarginata]|nr:hypothetical protein B0H14DRAFT_3445924 [Mycena olivaceomarginata]